MRARHVVFSVGFFAIDVRVLDVRLLLRSLLPDATAEIYYATAQINHAIVFSFISFLFIKRRLQKSIVLHIYGREKTLHPLDQ